MEDFRLNAEDAGNLPDSGRAKAGDLEAFDQLMRLHEKQVLGTALRLLGIWKTRRMRRRKLFCVCIRA